MNAPPPPPPQPPPPPPHGSRQGNASSTPGSGGLPPGNYDIFVIPPHSSGSGFLYLPSLQPHRNSFLAGVVCTLLTVVIWSAVITPLRHWTSTTFSSGGSAMIVMLAAVAVIGWALGKTQLENATGSNANANVPPGPQPTPGPSASGPSYAQPNPNSNPKPSFQHQQQQYQGTSSTSPGSSAWEQAKERMRKQEEERKKKEEAERRAEKDRWEKSRQREKEAREKEAREKEARAKETREREIREKLQQERARKERDAEKDKQKANSNYQRPTAQTYAPSEDAYSFRPYDQPKQPSKMASNSSFLSGSTASYTTGTHSTDRTTPPPSHRGPYVNKDPDKVTIRAVYALTDQFVKPVAQLVSGQGQVTEGLVLRMTTEGLFIDDDRRGVPQREWDVKAWTMKLVESGDLRGKHVLRASIRDAENKKYVFIIDDSEAWKVAVGLQRLRRGSQVRQLGHSGLSVNEMNNILKSLGWG